MENDDSKRERKANEKRTKRIERLTSEICKKPNRKKIEY